MAKASSSTAVAERPESNAFKLGGEQLPDEMMREALAEAGAGTSGLSDDTIIPFLVLLQDMNPEVKRRDAAYVEGAEPGLFLLRGLNRLYKEPIVQPCGFQREIVEWVPRDQGGGFAGRHLHDKPTVEESLRAIGGKQVPDPRDSTGKKMIWVLNNGNELIDTRYHFVNLLDPDLGPMPAVFALSSTGHTPSREWMSLMRAAKVAGPSGVPVVAPSWFKTYKVSSRTKSNNQGEWFIPHFDDNGWVSDPVLRAMGKALHTSVSSGAVRAADDAPVGGEGADDRAAAEAI